MSAATSLRVVPHNADPRQKMTAVQTDLKQQVEKLKAGSKDHASATRLIAALEALWAREVDPVRLELAKRLIGARLKRLKRVQHKLEADQRRDLMIVLFFNDGKIPMDMRKDAFAILQLWGDDKSRAIVCSVFPGLRLAFERDG